MNWKCLFPACMRGSGICCSRNSASCLTARNGFLLPHTAAYPMQMALLTARKDVVQAVISSLSRHRHRLELLQQRLVDASPEKLLARGYSITLKDGKVVKNVGLLNEGDEITTLLQIGEVTSIVNRKPSNRK